MRDVQVSSRPSRGTTYGAGEEIKVRVGFDLPLKVAGSPQLALSVGDRLRQACYSGSSVSRSSLFFRYRVQAVDAAPGGIAVAADALSLNGGSIRSTAGISAILNLGSQSASRQDSKHRVDGSIVPDTRRIMSGQPHTPKA